MDEARFVFEFQDRTGNSRAPGGGSPGQGGGQKSDPSDYQDTQGKADDQNTKRTKPSTIPASVPGTQASKPSDTKRFSLSDTFTEVSGIIGQASNAVRSLPKSPADVISTGKTVADTLTRTASIADRLFSSAGASTASASAVGAAGRAVGAGATAAGGAATGAAGLGAAAASIAGPVAYGAALLATPVAVAAFTANRMSEIASSSAAQYSPEVARALAMAEVRQIQADIRTAQRQGERVADFVESQSIAKSQFQRIKDSAVGALGDEINVAADLQNIIGDRIAKLFEGQEGVNDYWRKKLGLDKIYEKIDEMAKKLGDTGEISYFDWFRQQPHIAPPNMTFDEDESVKDPRFSPVPGLVF